jgi:UDP-N-acetylglucosamine:LPS N-acetylglucosamine transferase
MVACSAGGHWVQMRRILPAFDGFDVFYVGVEPAPDPAIGAVRYYQVANVTRKNPQAIVGILRSLRRILGAERPDLVVTTGAAPGFLALGMAKLGRRRCRTIWIDSIANTEKVSLSGRLARPVADAWLVQWEHLSRPGGPEFWGAVL